MCFSKFLQKYNLPPSNEMKYIIMRGDTPLSVSEKLRIPIDEFRICASKCYKTSIISLNGKHQQVEHLVPFTSFIIPKC